MKKIANIITIIITILSIKAMGQNVGIGTVSPTASAILDIESIDKGVLIPRMTKVQRESIMAVDGLLVYQIDNSAGFYYYKGTGWTVLVDTTTSILKIDDLLDAKHQGTSLFLGNEAGLNNTTGNNNTAVGFQALTHNTTGNNNTSVGLQALFSNIEGSSNTAMGISALYNNIDGQGNTAFGYSALYNNTTGDFNTTIGRGALYHNVSGSKNTVLGYNAGFNCTDGHRNVFIGHNAGKDESGSDKLYIENTLSSTPLIWGDFATDHVKIYGKLGIKDEYAFPIVDGTTNQILKTDGSGQLSWETETGGADDLGNHTATMTLDMDSENITNLADPTNGSDAVTKDYVDAITIDKIADADNDTKILVEQSSDEDTVRIIIDGTERLKIDNKGKIGVYGSSNSLYIGDRTGHTGAYNVGLGWRCLQHNTSGDFNTAIGVRAMNHNTTGKKNVGIGHWVLNENISGDYNVGIGSNALINNISGKQNTATGHTALSSNETGNYNTAIGDSSLMINKSGHYSTAIGHYALRWSRASNNTSVGAYSLEANTTGDRNTAIGREALRDNTIGKLRTAVGYRANSLGSGRDNSTGLGYNARPTTANRIHIGNTSITDIKGQVNWGTYSDRRIKNNIYEDVSGLNFIMRLRPVTFHYDIDKQQSILYNEIDQNKWKGKYDIEKIKFSGFIAQEVANAARASDYEFSGVTIPEDESHDLYTLKMAEFIPPIVKAIQEQNKVIANYELRITNQNKSLQDQQVQIKMLNDRLSSIEAALGKSH